MEYDEFLKHVAKLSREEQIDVLTELAAYMVTHGIEIPEASRRRLRALGVTIADVSFN